jgi:hypothetical protein
MIPSLSMSAIDRIWAWILDGLGDTSLSARLDPQPGQCCVVISAAALDR